MIHGEYNEHTLILKIGCFREADCWVRLFSPSQGVITAFAFGGSKSRKRFMGCLDLFNHVLFRIKSSRCGKYACLEEGVLLNGFSRLRRDSARTGMAVNCMKFLEIVQIGPQDAKSAYELLLATLEHLESAVHVSPLFPMLFRAKVVCEQGYLPVLDRCAGCGKPTLDISGPLFSIDGGRVYCQNCHPAEGNFLRIHSGSLTLLQAIVDNGPFVLPEGNLQREVQRDFFLLTDAFIQYHLGVIWENGRFKRV
ncbi:MAG: DNA repair protein RecO [Desulfovibrionales bacterium]